MLKVVTLVGLHEFTACTCCTCRQRSKQQKETQLVQKKKPGSLTVWTLSQLSLALCFSL